MTVGQIQDPGGSQLHIAPASQVGPRAQGQPVVDGPHLGPYP